MFTFIAFAAGLVRGYSGFGFAMLMALGLMLRLPPAEAVPVALILDVPQLIQRASNAAGLAFNTPNGPIKADAQTLVSTF